MVLPLLILGGAAILAGGIGTGLALQEGDVTNNSTQITKQYDYITSKSFFDFSNSTFKKGSNINLSTSQSVTTKKSAKQDNEQKQDKEEKISKYALIGCLVVGAYIFTKK